MATVTLQTNPYNYPQYLYSAVPTVKVISNVTPKYQDSRHGYIQVQLDTRDDMYSFNYLKLEYISGGRDIHAWVTDIEEISGNYLYRIHYEIDAYRTFISRCTIGNQFVLRNMTPNHILDGLLHTNPYWTESTHAYAWDAQNMGYAVMQYITPDDEQPWAKPGPVPYDLYFIPYTDSGTPPIGLARALRAMATGSDTNLVGIYTIPYVNLSGATLWADEGPRKDWYYFDTADYSPAKFQTEVLISLTSSPISITDTFFQTEHDVTVVIPNAGIMKVPENIQRAGSFYLRMMVDPYTGTASYDIKTTSGAANLSGLKDKFLRSPGLGAINVVTDQAAAYQSQNRNQINASVLTDTAQIVGGAALILSGNPAGIASGIGMASSGIGNTVARKTMELDLENRISESPTSFAGCATVYTYYNQFWIIKRSKAATNASVVHTRYGYPQRKFMPVSLPTSANPYLQLEAANIKTDGTVPLWAVNEIEGILNNGIYYQTS